MNPAGMRDWLKFYRITKAKNAFGSMEQDTRTLVMQVKAERVFTTKSEKMMLGEAEQKRKIFKTRYYADINDTKLILQHKEADMDVIGIEEIGRKKGLIFTAQG